MNGEPRKRPPVDESEHVPEAPNEGAPGHHPDAERDGGTPREAGGQKHREDAEAEQQSFPASDPPGNY